MRGISALAAIVVVTITAGCSGDDSSSNGTATPTPTSTPFGFSTASCAEHIEIDGVSVPLDASSCTGECHEIPDGVDPLGNRFVTECVLTEETGWVWIADGVATRRAVIGPQVRLSAVRTTRCFSNERFGDGAFPLEHLLGRCEERTEIRTNDRHCEPPDFCAYLYGGECPEEAWLDCRPAEQPIACRIDTVHLDGAPETSPCPLSLDLLLDCARDPARMSGDDGFVVCGPAGCGGGVPCEVCAPFLRCSSRCEDEHCTRTSIGREDRTGLGPIFAPKVVARTQCPLDGDPCIVTTQLGSLELFCDFGCQEIPGTEEFRCFDETVDGPNDARGVATERDSPCF